MDSVNSQTMWTQDQCEKQLLLWVRQDPWRMSALLAANELGLPQWFLAAGFVRNLVWDHLHCLPVSQLNDIDLIYFDPVDTSIESEKTYQTRLLKKYPSFPWSIKNQARMHSKNGDSPYTSSINAMGFWPEKETAIGITLSIENGAVEPTLRIDSAFGLTPLFQLKLSHNPVRERQLFERRVQSKSWLKRYPYLQCD